MPRSALIVVDMINRYDHPDGDELARSAERALPQMVRLVERAAERDVLTIYVNDTFGAWTSDRDQLVEHDIRHLAVAVPSDATAHIDQDLARCALRMMEPHVRAEVAPAEEVDLT